MAADIRLIERDQLVEVRRLLERSNDTPYDLARVADEKCFGEGVAGEPTLHGAFRANQLAGIVVTCGRHLRLLAVDRAHRRQGLGSALLEAAESDIAAQGNDEINVAA